MSDDKLGTNGNLQRIEREISQTDPDLFKGLDPSKKKAVVQTVYRMSKLHIGPLPSPDSLAEYNQVIPNAAERIFTEFEEQGKHRRQLEKKVIGGQVVQSFIGQALGFIIAISFGAASVWCFSKGYEFGGSAIGVADLASLVAVFVKGKYYQRENLSSKDPKNTAQ
jgi:uncharacterized membrane protein